MRVPNLNVSQSIMQQLRDLDSQRLKLNDQISTGQKITRPQDDGLTMGRVIQLDSQKGKLAQYQRNASYASEYLNAGHMNLDKLREINQRAQEISRLAGSNLNGPGVTAYASEIDQLLEEALNRLNSKHRGRALFGGHELKPNFAISDIISEDMETKFLNLNSNSVGIEKVGGKRYLKQGDELSVAVNGREYVVQAKALDVVDYDPTQSFSKGDTVKVITPKEDLIVLDPELISEPEGGVAAPSLFDTVIEHLERKDWSKTPAGTLEDGTTNVFLLDSYQIENLAVSLGKQPYVDQLPSAGGYFAVSEQPNGEVYLEPVTNEIDTWSPNQNYVSGDYVSWGHEIYRANGPIPIGSDFNEELWETVSAESVSDLFSLTESTLTEYWEAVDNVPANLESPSKSNLSWKEVDITDRVSNLSTENATGLLRDLINSDPFFLEDSKVLINEDSYAFIRSSSNPNDRYDSDLDISAKVDSTGQLLISSRVGSSFDIQASYISSYDAYNYYPNQLDAVVRQKASSMFPNLSFDDLDEKAKELVWAEVKSSKITWDLSVSESSGTSGTTLHSKLPSSWARLQVYQIGDIVEYDGKLWESKQSENFNHFPTNPSSEYWEEIGSGYDEHREDWNLQSIGTTVQYFFTSPDGRLFHDRSIAETHTYDLLVGSDRNYASVNEIWSDIDKLVKEVAYPVSEFQAKDRTQRLKFILIQSVSLTVWEFWIQVTPRFKVLL